MSIVDEYHFNVAFSPEDDAFISTCEEFPSLKVHGKTGPKAISDLTALVNVIITDMERAGERIPRPGEYMT